MKMKTLKNNLINNEVKDEEILKKEDMNNNLENNEINNKNDMDENRIESNINVIRDNEKEDIHQDIEEDNKNSPEVIEGGNRSIGINTIKLSPIELQRMVESNYEIMDTNMEDDQYKEEHEIKLKEISELEKEIKDKDQI